jgi:hypothetical protein
MYDLEKIRAKISLADLAEEAGAVFSSPNRLLSHCPLPRHAGDRNSHAFSIYADGQRWKCHSSCPPDANGGDIFAFYMAWKGVDFKAAVAELAERIRLPASERTGTAPLVRPQPQKADQNPLWLGRAQKFMRWAQQNLAKDSHATAYLSEERGLSVETQRAFHLGYNPRNIYEESGKWGLTGKKIWLPRGIVIPGIKAGQPAYLKIRRPLPGDRLGDYIPPWMPADGLDTVKFGGPRGGQATLFRLALKDTLPVLFLTEGEWDTMLLWEHVPDLCDVATLGGAGRKLHLPELSLLTRYLAILVVLDDDQAGAQGLAYFRSLQAQIPRLHPIPSPAHDLTDYWKSGGNLRAWATGHIALALEKALSGTEITEPLFSYWKHLLALAQRESKTH